MKLKIFAGCFLLLMFAVFSLPNAGAAEINKINTPFTAAAIQFDPVLNERDKNIEGLLKVIEEAAKNGAKLIVAPEMATTGYYYADRDAIKAFMDTIPGYTTQRMFEIAKKYDAYIVVGMAEIDKKTGLGYNSAALVGPEGYIGKYRKTHQWETEEHWSTWGDVGVGVFDTKLGKIAMNICMDSAYFEPARLAAIGGADILAFPTNSSAQAIASLQARAIQNGMYIVSANRSNTERDFHMVGASAIWSPTGEKLVEAAFIPSPKEDAKSPSIVYAQIDPQKYQNPGKDRLKERRPELYKDLMLYIAPWDYAKTTTPVQVTAAALQYEPLINKEANLKTISRQMEAASRNAAIENKTINLFVLPEMSATGYLANPDEIKKAAETLDGDIVKAFSQLAKQYKAHIVFGLIEKDGKDFYNTAALLNPQGNLVGTYRQTHLTEADKTWAKSGNKIGTFTTEIGKIGLMLGYDATFPEVAGVLAVKRADIIAMPTRWTGELDKTLAMNPNISANKYPKEARALWDSTAMTTQAYTIVANYIGTKENYCGSSGLYTLDPLYGLDQPVFGTTNGEEAVVVNFTTIQPDWWFNQQMLINCRRPHVYIPLIE